MQTEMSESDIMWISFLKENALTTLNSLTTIENTKYITTIDT